MAIGPITQVSDIVVPEIFNVYVRQASEEKSELIQSGAVLRDSAIDNLLQGGGLTFNTPSFKPLDDDESNISSDEAADRFTGGNNDSVPKKIGTATEVAVRLSRNQSWSDSDLAAALAGADPMLAIAADVGRYWALDLQKAFLATMNGVFADNDANDGGDYTVNIVEGSTTTSDAVAFNPDAFIDMSLTLEDSMEDLGLLLVHPVVKARMKKRNLIETIVESNGAVRFDTYQGYRVVMDKRMPSNDGVYETWAFAPGAVRLGIGTPRVPTATEREEAAGNGGGQSILYNRTEWCIHPVGYAYTGATPSGGPDNTATTGNLAHAGSWDRVYSDRRQIKIARLITREADAAV